MLAHSPSSIRLRLATETDLPAIVEIYNQAIAAGQKTADTEPVDLEERTRWFRGHRPDIYPIYVAEEAGQVLGYMSLSPYRNGRKALIYTAEVSFYIHFEHHRRGLGSMLLQHAIDISPSLNFKTLFGILFASNTGSVSLFEKFGFERWGLLPRVAEYKGVEFDHAYYGLRLCD